MTRIKLSKNMVTVDIGIDPQVNNRPTPAKPGNEKLRHGYLFGPASRYMLHEHVSQRDGIPGCWMVLDAETPDPVTGRPACVRQAETPEDAVAALI